MRGQSGGRRNRLDPMTARASSMDHDRKTWDEKKVIVPDVPLQVVMVDSGRMHLASSFRLSNTRIYRPRLGCSERVSPSARQLARWTSVQSMMVRPLESRNRWKLSKLVE